MKLMYRQTKNVDWLSSKEGTAFTYNKNGYLVSIDNNGSPLGVNLGILDDKDAAIFKLMNEQEMKAQQLIEKLEKSLDVNRYRAFSLRRELYKIVDTERYENLQFEVRFQIDSALETL